MLRFPLRKPSKWVHVVLLAVALTGPAVADDDATPGGLAPLGVDSAAAVNKALAEFDRSPDTVVAEVGARTVTWGDVADAIRALPRITLGIPFTSLFQAAVAQVMQTRALAERAESFGMDKSPVVRRRMKNAADEVLADEILRRSLAPNVSEKALRAVYDGVIAGKPGPDEVQARLIAVDTKDQAMAVIARLKKGEGFADLARQISKDGTAANGGELGYVRLDMMAPEIGAVMFALAVGETTSYPVRSGNLWFVVQVESRREVPAPSFEAARFALEQDVLHAGIPELRKQALREAKIKFYGLSGQKNDKK